MKRYNAFQIKLWIDRNLPQISWNILVLSCSETFVREGISPRMIDIDTTFSELLVNKLSQQIIDKYEQVMPMEDFEIDYISLEK